MKVLILALLITSGSTFADSAFENYRAVIQHLEDSHHQSQKIESAAVFKKENSEPFKNLQQKLQELREALLVLEVSAETDKANFKNKLVKQGPFFRALKAAFNQIDRNRISDGLRKSYGMYWQAKNRLKKSAGITGRP